MTKAKENGAASLTLCKGAKVVTFRHMDVRDHAKRDAETERQRLLTLAAYPELKRITGTPAFEDHADFPDYSGQLGTRTEHAPWLLAACNEPLTIDDILASDMDEVMDCTAAVMTENSKFRLLFPRLVQILNPEKTDPNS